MPDSPPGGHDLVVMGASMDGLSVLSTIMAGLPADFAAAVCVVQHTSPNSPGYVAEILGAAGPLPAVTPDEGEPITPGRLYVAPPDRHLLVRDGRLHLGRGPRENRTRPAIDPLFRTAAVAYRSRTIGVVLTGLLDDGAAGLAAIKQCGGLAIVQDPADAPFPDMPEAALDAVRADHVVPAREMGPLLARLVHQPAPDPPPIPDDLLMEARLTHRVQDGQDATRDAQQLGDPIMDMCPECGGQLRQLPGEHLQRFRCYLGHTYTAQTLLADQANNVERALWAALRQLEERLRMLVRMARQERDRDRYRTAADFDARAEEVEEHIKTLRDLLQHAH
ncbi:MAG TPA: chemotaxis protein CheB [Rhodothermales bacterium]|nr:chemotaxis protein CheB [Rhodothermales bacterium]